MGYVGEGVYSLLCSKNISVVGSESSNYVYPKEAGGHGFEDVGDPSRVIAEDRLVI